MCNKMESLEFFFKVQDVNQRSTVTAWTAMGKNTIGVTKEIPVAKSHCLTGQKKSWKLSLDLNSGSECGSEMLKDSAWRVSAFGSSGVRFFPPLCSVTMERKQELHSSAFDAGLRAEPGWHSTAFLPPSSSCCHVELFSFMKATDCPPSVQWPSGKGWISGL